MIVCVCMDINERAIVTAINNGHDTQEKLVEELQVCVSCGSCEDQINELIDNHK